MRPQAHLASALLVWSATGAPLRQAPVDALAGNLPDLDRNVAKLLGVTRRDHHRWVSHSLAGWLLPAVLARRHPAARRVVALAWLHLALDTYYDGLAWLWPLDDTKRGLFRKPPHIRDDGWRTPAPLDTEPGVVELAMWLATAALVARRARRLSRAATPRARRRRRRRGHRARSTTA